jgi:CHAT domain-containing protein/tetratricopeptide (TPR) repeat protein
MTTSQTAAYGDSKSDRLPRAAAVFFGAILCLRCSTPGTVSGRETGTSITHFTLETARHQISTGGAADVEIWASGELQGARARQADPLEIASLIDLVVASACREMESCRGLRMETLAMEAIHLKEQALGPRALELVESLGHLATVQTTSTQWDAARQNVERAVAILEFHHGPNSPKLLETLHRLIQIHFHSASVAGAVATARRMLPISESAFGSHHKETIRVIQEVSKYARLAGWYDEALEHAIREISILEEIGATQTAEYGTALKQRGIVLMDMGDFEGARRDLDASLEVRRRILRPDHSEIGQSLHNLSHLHFLMGDYEESRRLEEETVAIWVKDRPTGDADIALARMRLGDALRELGDLEGAREQQKEAVRILDAYIPGSHPYQGLALGALGETQFLQGDTQGARQSLTTALDLAFARYGEDSATTSMIALRLARAELAAGLVKQALPRAQRALAALRKTLGNEHPHVAEALTVIAQAAAASGHQAEARDLSLLAAETARKHLRFISRTFPEPRALKYARVSRQALDLAISLHSAPPSPANWDLLLGQIVRCRAQVLDEMAERQRAIGHLENKEVARLHQDLDRARNARATLIVQGPRPEDTSTYGATLERYTAEVGRLERELLKVSAPFREQGQRDTVGLQEIRAALPEGVTLVSYVQYSNPEPAYAALVLPGSDDPARMVPLGPAAGLDGLIRRWRSEAGKRPPVLPALARDAEQEYLKAGHALRRALWDPLEPAVPKASMEVLVVPDGEISLVNLATLPSPSGRGFLLEAGPSFSYLSAERDLVPRVNRQVAGTVIVFGGPDFDGQPAPIGSETTTGDTARMIHRGAGVTCDEFRSTRFARLPAAEQEAHDVASIWREAHVPSHSIEVLTGSQADESTFKRLVPGYRVVHVATHGFFLGSQCAGGDENPLSRTGLVFAGANRRQDASRDPFSNDGILTAEEIAALDLSGVEWAVLSACDTAWGDLEAGEGVLGLRRAFGVAGVDNLVISLWQIADDTTRIWMRELYRSHLRGRSPADSTRDASLAMLHSQRRHGLPEHPYFWGGFIATGR